MTLPRTSGDDREDAAAAGTAARDAFQRAELVILAGMAAALRKMASGMLIAAMAQRRARALVSVTLGEAMRQIRPLLDGLPRRRGNRCEPRSCRRRPAPSPAAESMAATMSALFDPGRALLLRRGLRRPATAARERRRAKGVPAGRRAAGYGCGQLPSEHALELQ